MKGEMERALLLWAEERMDPWKDGATAEGRVLGGSYVKPRSLEFSVVLEDHGTDV